MSCLLWWKQFTRGWEMKSKEHVYMTFLKSEICFFFVNDIYCSSFCPFSGKDKLNQIYYLTLHMGSFVKNLIYAIIHIQEICCVFILTFQIVLLLQLFRVKFCPMFQEESAWELQTLLQWYQIAKVEVVSIHPPINQYG